MFRLGLGRGLGKLDLVTTPRSSFICCTARGNNLGVGAPATVIGESPLGGCVRGIPSKAITKILHNHVKGLKFLLRILSSILL